MNVSESIIGQMVFERMILREADCVKMFQDEKKVLIFPLNVSFIALTF